MAWNMASTVWKRPLPPTTWIVFVRVLIASVLVISSCSAYPKQSRLFTQAIGRSQTSGAIIPRYLGQSGLAMAQFCSGRKSALDDLETALKEMQSYQNPVGAASAAQMMGVCLMQTGALDRAESYLNIACDFYRRSGMIPYLSRSLSNLAQLFEKENRFKERAENSGGDANHTARMNLMFSSE